MTLERPCHCGRALKGVPLDKFDDSVPPERKQCVICWLSLNDPAYQKLWGLESGDEGGKVDAAALPVRNCCGE